MKRIVPALLIPKEVRGISGEIPLGQRARALRDCENAPVVIGHPIPKNFLQEETCGKVTKVYMKDGNGWGDLEIYDTLEGKKALQGFQDGTRKEVSLQYSKINGKYGHVIHVGLVDHANIPGSVIEFSNNAAEEFGYPDEPWGESLTRPPSSQGVEENQRMDVESAKVEPQESAPSSAPVTTPAVEKPSIEDLMDLSEQLGTLRAKSSEYSFLEARISMTNDLIADARGGDMKSLKRARDWVAAMNKDVSLAAAEQKKKKTESAQKVSVASAKSTDEPKTDAEPIVITPFQAYMASVLARHALDDGGIKKISGTNALDFVRSHNPTSSNDGKYQRHAPITDFLAPSNRDSRGNLLFGRR